MTLSAEQEKYAQELASQILLKKPQIPGATRDLSVNKAVVSFIYSAEYVKDLQDYDKTISDEDALSAVRKYLAQSIPELFSQGHLTLPLPLPEE